MVEKHSICDTSNHKKRSWQCWPKAFVNEKEVCSNRWPLEATLYSSGRSALHKSIMYVYQSHNIICVHFSLASWMKLSHIYRPATGDKKRRIYRNMTCAFQLNQLVVYWHGTGWFACFMFTIAMMFFFSSSFLRCWWCFCGASCMQSIIFLYKYAALVAALNCMFVIRSRPKFDFIFASFHKGISIFAILFTLSHTYSQSVSYVHTVLLVIAIAVWFGSVMVSLLKLSELYIAAWLGSDEFGYALRTWLLLFSSSPFDFPSSSACFI